MTESISKIANLSAIAGDGTGSARNRKRYKRLHRDEEHDSVFISDEARRRSASDDEDERLSEQWVPADRSRRLHEQ